MYKKLGAVIALTTILTVVPPSNRNLHADLASQTSDTTAQSSIYPDVQGHWASSYINSITDQHIITGYPDGTFHPDETISRAQFTSMVIRALAMPVRNGSDFPDTNGHWAAGSMATARLYGIINGFPDGTAHPDEKITRAQMAAMFVRALHLSQTGPDFPDSLNHWAKADIEKVSARQYMTGLPGGLFAPDQQATRGEAAAVLARALDNRPKTVLGFAIKNYAEDVNSLHSIQRYGFHLSHMANFRYGLTQTGQLFEYNNQDTEVSESRQQGIIPLLTVDNGYNASLVGQVMGSNEARGNLIRNLSASIQQKGYLGVNIDLENIPSQYRTQYTQFLIDLRNTLHPQGYLLTASIPAKSSDTLTNSWMDTYDYKAIGESCDLVMLMTYDENWFGGSAGPVASYAWTERCLQYGVSRIPKEKLLLGIAAYGYDWPDTPNTNAKAITSYKMDNLLAQYGGQMSFDQTAKEDTYSYIDTNNVKHTVWIEDAASLPFKLDLANQYGIRGIGIWRLGFENQSFWDTLQNKWNQ